VQFHFRELLARLELKVFDDKISGLSPRIIGRDGCQPESQGNHHQSATDFHDTSSVGML
jgi:hypothetical protein